MNILDFFKNMYPFPIVKSYPTDKTVTDIFLHVADSDFVVKHNDEKDKVILESSNFRLEFWDKNLFYGWAWFGTFVNKKNGVTYEWEKKMPSRYAMKKMKDSIDRNIKNQATDVLWGI